MSRVRRRLSRGSTAIARWERDRDWHMSRSQPGERPVQWWKYESDRPDLAGGTDLYAHLSLDRDPRDGLLGLADLSEATNPRMARACARLRYLRDSGELTPDEIAEIHRRAATLANPGRWSWRSAVLREQAR